MRTFLTIAILAFAAALAGTTAPAQAQIYYPWCVQYMPDGGRNCGFVSFEQCQLTAQGAGGYCERNSFYTGPAPVRRKPKPRQG